jgi:ankyrin repeat protein
LGRVTDTDPREAFYLNNPPPPGQVRRPVAAVDAYDDFGYTLLIKAVQSGNQAEVIKLLDNKANPNLFSARRLTALEVAAGGNDLEMVCLPLKRVARANLGYFLKYMPKPRK